MANHNGRIALDIETISPNLGPNDRPDFEDPNDFEIFIIGLGYQSPDGDIADLSALFRTNPTPEAELGLIQEAINWIDAYEAEQLITYNGSTFDLTHLQGRPELIEGEGGSVTTLVQDTLTAFDHLDLKHAAWRQFGDYTTLEELCRYIGEPVEETKYADFEHGFELGEVLNHPITTDLTVESGHIPEIGERWLNAVSDFDGEGDTDETRKMLEHYALADIKPLFKLADAHPF